MGVKSKEMDPDILARIWLNEDIFYVNTYNEKKDSMLQQKNECEYSAGVAKMCLYKKFPKCYCS